MTTPKHKQYDVAKNMFVDQGMTCNAISDILSLTQATLSKWRKGMKWDDERSATLSRPDKIKAILLAELQSISEGNKPRIDTDALSKVSKTLSYFDGKVPFGAVLAVIKELDNWTCEIEPVAAVANTDLHKRFLQYRAQLDSLK